MHRLPPVRTAAPSSDDPLLTTAEAKAHCRVDHSTDDTLIASLVAAATAHLDGWAGILGRCLVTQTWRQDLCGFPAGSEIRLPLAPVQSVTVAYSDDADDEQTLDGENYRLLPTALGASIFLVEGASWPSTYRREDAVRISMTCGYGAASAVPQAIKQAALLMVGHWYANREAVNVGSSVTDFPMAVQALLAPFRRVGP